MIEPDGRTVYVPAPGSDLRRTIAPGSGIVGTAVPGTDKVLIDYEGAIYGQAMDYEERIYHAHDRHTWRGRGYPTAARVLVDAGELVEVGTLTRIAHRPWVRVTLTRPELLEEWCA